MADADSRQQNQAFLQQMERQRLQKPCIRVIDLRGKVIGECQAYQIGQQTHYLDDRSYLLLKTLLERSDNKFTVGVFEAWQKARELLDKQTTTSEAQAPKPILLRDADRYQKIDFSQTISRRELRLNIATNVLVDVDELRYHATTIDMSVSGMRISMRPTQYLQKDQHVLISLPQLQENAPENLLTELTYQITSLQHTPQQTIAIIQRQCSDDIQLNDWLTQWLHDQQSLSVVNLDSELLNIANEYYLRLFCQYFTSPLFWAEQSLSNILFTHSSEPAESVLNSLEKAQVLNKLPIQALQAAQAVLIQISQDDTLSWADTNNAVQIQQLSSHKAAKKQYLLRKQTITFSAEQVSQTLEPLAARQTDLALSLAEKLQQCQHLLTLTDISAGNHDFVKSDEISEHKNASETSISLPEAQRLNLYITRSTERYEIHTPIQLHINQQQLSLVTNELSAGGLSVRVPASQSVTTGSRVTVDFTRWQQQSKLKLTQVPYEVRSQQHWQGMTLLGLRRLVESCPSSINTFFEQILAENKPTLGVRNDDLALQLSSRLFANQLRDNLADVLLFFGLDTDNNRILQAVASTANNNANAHQSLWQAISYATGRLTQPLKLPISDLQTGLQFGLYAFRRTKESEWQISSDLMFEDMASKQFFINRAMNSAEYRFYNCQLQPIKPSTWPAAADLQQQLTQLRRHNNHKVKQIRETLSSLFAIAQLTDITQVLVNQFGNKS